MKSIFKSIIVAIITWQAKMVLRKYKPKIVAVTGSVGKTGSKDAIDAVLSKFVYVRKSRKSFNSEIGVPLTILNCPNGWNNPLVWLKNVLDGFALILLPNHYPDWLVLEVGADRPGDIQIVTEWLRPDISVVTKLSKVPVHVEYFRSVGEVLQEKSFIVRNMGREGVAVLNADDEDVFAFQGLTDNKKIFFGKSDISTIRGENFHITYNEEEKPIGISFRAVHLDESADVFIKGALGIQQMYIALSALAVGHALGFPLKKMAKAFEDFEPSPSRMRLISGVKESVVIDDSYNSSPVALEEALRTLKEIKSKGKKIAVLGDMLELGIYSTDEHKKAGEMLSGTCDILITAGVRARFFAEGALNAEMDESKIFQFEDSVSAGKQAELLSGPGDVILIKGSQGVRMEKAVEEVMAHPEKKDSLLCRQEEEWKNR